MHEKVKQFVERQEREKVKRREQHLINLGLVEKVYSDSWHRDYPHWDSIKQKYCKLVPIDVTDEEYALICSYVKEGEKGPGKTNLVATVLKVIGWVILVGGFLAGLILASLYNYGFDWAIAIGYWEFALLSGIIFLALAEIIALLQVLVNKERQ
ncbi:MAG TPA: hypothetical protein PKL39_01185 [Bacillota bacterium]|nr:hypothetical protein [Bacillota bacterium]